jgi:two-component system sensor histidine kinase CiaH
VELARSEEALPPSAVAAVPFSELAEGCIENFRPLAESAGKELTAEISPGLCISGVPDDISRLLTILLDNAVKYCDAGGTIHLAAFSRRKSVELALSNPCAGIDAAQLPHYFDRFYRADSSRARATGGSGIGLSTATAITGASALAAKAASSPFRSRCRKAAGSKKHRVQARNRFFAEVLDILMLFCYYM